MKKRKPLMKFLTLVMAATLMMSMSVTAFATENNADQTGASCCTTDENANTTCTHTDDECDMTDCPIHGNTAKQTENKCKCDNADCDCTECSMECENCETCHGCKSGCGKAQETTTGSNDQNNSEDQNKADENKTDENFTPADGARTATENDANKTDVSGNSSDDVDSAKAGKTDTTDKDKGDNDKGMSADKVNEDSETVKTGEPNVLPIVLGFAMIAAGAGVGFMVMRKKEA